MYEIIEKQFKSGKALTQSKYYSLIRRDLWPKYYWDMYPLAQEYYHELNPYFLFNIFRPDLFKFTPVITVRDGYLNFANFILGSSTVLPKMGPKLYIIHPSLAPLVPSHLKEYFLTWKIVQKKQLTPETARKVFVFANVSEQYLGDVELLRNRVEALKRIPKSTPVDFYIPLRKNVFELQGKESFLLHNVVSMLKDVLPERKFNFLTGDNFFAVTDFKNNYMFDLAKDNFLVSDNYLHQYVQGRGATVNNSSLTEAPKDSMFSFELSIHHEFHVCPFPDVQSAYPELLFYKKKYATVKDFLFDPGFQALVSKIVNK